MKGNKLYGPVMRFPQHLFTALVTPRCIALVVAIESLSSDGQVISSVNFGEMKMQAADSTSARYYPVLLQRLRSFDTTLTKYDYEAIYYGSVFQQNYQPYSESVEKSAFLVGFREIDQYETDQDRASLIELANRILEQNPIDLEVLIGISILHHHFGITEVTRKYASVYYNFLDIIYQSGDGLCDETAFVVTSVHDEYRIVADLGLHVTGQELIGDCDVLYFSAKGQKGKRIKQMFFNVRMPLASLSPTFERSNLPEPDPWPDE